MPEPTPPKSTFSPYIIFKEEGSQTLYTNVLKYEGVNMIELFILETCPYCKKVMSFFNDNKIEYKKIDIANKDSEEALIRIGGKRQVPFMIDTDRNIQMYESDDIIEYIKTLKN